MASLSSIYGIGAAIGTIAAFVAAYVGHTIYPIQTGGNVQSVIETVTEKANDIVENISKPAEQPLNTEVTPLEAPVEEQPLPQVDLAPENNPFQSEQVST